MALQGLRDTSGFITDQRPKNFREGVLLYGANGKAPLTALTSLMKSKKVDDPEFSWWEKARPTQRMQVTADVLIGGTAFPVASGASQVKRGHVIRVEQSEELMLVVADPVSDTAITVSRGFAGTSAAAFDFDGASKNPFIHIVGNFQSEGSMPPTGIAYDPTKKYNYTQIFRNTLEMTRTASKTRLRTGDAIKEAKRECTELHSIEMEKNFIFGQRIETTLDGKPARMTGGVISFIDSGNVADQAGADMDMETLEVHLEKMFRYGSSEKIAFGGNLSLLAIQQIVRKNSAVQIMSGIKEFGMNVSRLICPFGELVIKTHPLFNELVGGTNSGGGGAYYGTNSWLLVLDQANLGYRFVDDTMWQAKLEANGLDGMHSGWLTEAGMEVDIGLSHYLLKGLAGGKVDT